jgi:hypothetical protein
MLLTVHQHLDRHHHLPIDCTGSQVKPLEFSRDLSLVAGGGHVIALLTSIAVILVISSAPWHSKMQMMTNPIDLY